ncbi:MAG: class I SAM-dependent methyltransferase [Verrucomicrobia bacterium]|nr:class I SAM-dependent methyltransferase [Verrucomicrobiota bacterium]
MNATQQINARSIELYDSSAAAHGISSRAVLMGDPQTQYLRFSELVRNLDLNSPNVTLLDVGCGNGELYKFLNFVGFRGRYTGYDINAKLLDQARARFAGIDVELVDIFEEAPGRTFDYVVSSGIFNAEVGQTVPWVQSFLKQKFSLCTTAMAFNAISTHVNFRDANMFYMDPSEMLSFCIRELSKRTSLMHHNLPYNYTVQVFKQDSWCSVREQIAA